MAGIGWRGPDRIVCEEGVLGGNLSLEPVIKSGRTNALIDNEAVGYEIVCFYNIYEQAMFVPIILFGCNPMRMVIRKKILLGSGVASVLALLAIPAYQPLKFHYAIWRIESAVTPAQERAACVLASRVGHVWEVNEIHPGEFRVLPSRVKPGTNDVITEIEWWESPWWKSIGQPYRAYRVLVDPKSRELLVAKSK